MSQVFAVTILKDDTDMQQDQGQSQPLTPRWAR